MPTWHKPNMLQHNTERIAGVDAAADDVADMMIMMIKIMVNEDAMVMKMMIMMMMFNDG